MTDAVETKQLRFSDNSKVKFKPRHKNTFGLLHGSPANGGTCPGATTGPGGCMDTRDGLKRKTCYVEKITQIYKAVGKSLKDNTNLLKDKTEEELVDILTNTVNAFIASSKGTELFFRLHWAGDFFSEDYARAWRTVMLSFPQVRFWAYTRSHTLVRELLDIPNLTLYLSVDPSNYRVGKFYYDIYKDRGNIALAFMGVAPKDYKFIVCPETSGKVKNTPKQGACSKCRLCINNYKDKPKHIEFVIH